MNLTSTQLRDVQHLAIDFHIEYDADAFHDLYINPFTKVPEFMAIDAADTGESRLYFTYSDPMSGDCDQFHIDNVADAIETVAAVAGIYRKLQYRPADLIRSFNGADKKQLEQLALLDAHFSIGIVSTHTKSFEVNKQLGAVYLNGGDMADYVDLYFTYKLGELDLDFSVEEIGADEIIEKLMEVASTYSELIDTPLEMLNHF